MDLHIPGRKGIVIAFEDDTSAMGDTRAIVRLAPLIKDIFAQDGFHVKVTKSTITGSDIETIASIDPLPDGFRLSAQGTTMLGVHIGNTTGDVLPSLSSEKCSQALLPSRLWALGLLLPSSCSPSTSAPSL